MFQLTEHHLDAVLREAIMPVVKDSYSGYKVVERQINSLVFSRISKYNNLEDESCVINEMYNDVMTFIDGLRSPIITNRSIG